MHDQSSERVEREETYAAEGLRRKIALVTGGSSGVGAATAVRFARRGYDVVINYRARESDAQRVVDEIIGLGFKRRAIKVQADLTDEGATRKMFEIVGNEWGHLNVLDLNASGGLEKGKSDDYAMRLNRDAQKRAVELALPLFPLEGGRVIYVTSNWAILYGLRGSLRVKKYEPVAKSKHAGEVELRKLMPALDARGISLVVVSGSVIEGTITPKLLELGQRGLVRRLREQAGSLTVEKFATTIANAADMPLLTGTTLVLGSLDDLTESNHTEK